MVLTRSFALFIANSLFGCESVSLVAYSGFIYKPPSVSISLKSNTNILSLSSSHSSLTQSANSLALLASSAVVDYSTSAAPVQTINLVLKFMQLFL